MRNRSLFYTSLGRLFLVDFNEDEERFDNFMMPITSERERDEGYQMEEIMFDFVFQTPSSHWVR